ncbi:hypothetical protein BH10PSE13_BH10PSE13_14150 [soil metagenome]
MSGRAVMSDIDIRFDGLLLAVAIMGSALLFAAILLGALGLALACRNHRVHLIGLGKIASWQLAISLVCLLAVIAVMARGSVPSTPDLIDWLTVPWALFVAFGLFRLIRFHTGRHERR